ncbi:MAG: futalosine hydrolase [Planctomycetota bacterium]
MKTLQHLILIPTEGERTSLLRQQNWARPDFRVELCGFGAVAAAARSAQLLATLQPQCAWLLGIAGAFDLETCPLESVQEFDAVVIHGIGAGEGETASNSEQLGFPQWPGEAESNTPSVFDKIHLRGPLPTRTLLTVCAASASPQQAAQRHIQFPDALAEDMEGFGVALACELTHTPLRILRGISNLAGNRNHREWRIQAALDRVRERLESELL